MCMCDITRINGDTVSPQFTVDISIWIGDITRINGDKSSFFHREHEDTTINDVTPIPNGTFAMRSPTGRWRDCASFSGLLSAGILLFFWVCPKMISTQIQYSEISSFPDSNNEFWGFICTPFSDRTTFRSQECKGGRLWRYPEDQLSAVCWAFARIRWHDAELFQDTSDETVHQWDIPLHRP